MRVTLTINGEKHDVTVRPIDHIRSSDTARKHHWPVNPEDDPIRAMYFLAFAAAQRSGIWPQEKGFDAFLEVLDDAETVDDDVHPTEAAS